MEWIWTERLSNRYGKEEVCWVVIRDQKNNLKMYIGKIGIIEMISEIEKPNEDSLQIQFYSN